MGKKKDADDEGGFRAKVKALFTKPSPLKVFVVLFGLAAIGFFGYSGYVFVKRMLAPCPPSKTVQIVI